MPAPATITAPATLDTGHAIQQGYEVLLPDIATTGVPTAGIGESVEPVAVSAFAAVPLPADVGVSAGDTLLNIGDLYDDTYRTHYGTLPIATAGIPTPTVGINHTGASFTATAAVPAPSVDVSNEATTVGPLEPALQAVSAVPAPVVSVDVLVTQLAGISHAEVSDDSDSTWVVSGASKNHKARFQLPNIGSFMSATMNVRRAQSGASPSQIWFGLFQGDTQIGSFHTNSATPTILTATETQTGLDAIADYSALEFRIGNNAATGRVNVYDIWLDTNLGIIRPVALIANEGDYWELPSTRSASAAIPAPGVTNTINHSAATITLVGDVVPASVNVANNVTNIPVSTISAPSTVSAVTLTGGTGDEATPATVAAVTSISAPAVLFYTDRSPATVSAVAGVGSVVVNTQGSANIQNRLASSSVVIPTVEVNAGNGAVAVAVLVGLTRPGISGSHPPLQDINILTSIPTPTVTAATPGVVTPNSVSILAILQRPSVAADPAWTHFYTDRAGVPA